MPQNKITIVGKLRFTEEKGLEESIPSGKTEKDSWRIVKPEGAEAIRTRLGKYPEPPEKKPEPSVRKDPDAWRKWSSAKKTAEDEWKLACREYDQKLYADPAFKRGQVELLELQHREPQETFTRGVYSYWFFHDMVLHVESKEPEAVRDRTADSLAIKQFVLRRERQYERVRREVEALENIEKLQGATREPIPDSVRLFVWQRDKGQCVKCGSQQRLEFDHIIPIASGGSNTERNVQLLCEACNRSKGATI
jgi:5-methylcytosine-specific restriction endonuclease McrA